MTLKEPKPSAPTAGLWWFALLILLAGGLVIYLLSLDPLAHGTRAHIAITAMFTIIGAGLCVIGATSQWWLRH